MSQILRFKFWDQDATSGSLSNVMDMPSTKRRKNRPPTTGSETASCLVCEVRPWDLTESGTKSATRRQISRQQKEILTLQRAGIPTASAEALLSRMQGKVPLPAARQ